MRTLIILFILAITTACSGQGQANETPAGDTTKIDMPIYLGQKDVVKLRSMDYWEVSFTPPNDFWHIVIKTGRGEQQKEIKMKFEAPNVAQVYPGANTSMAYVKQVIAAMQNDKPFIEQIDENNEYVRTLIFLNADSFATIFVNYMANPNLAK